jgi:polyisoprenoid-binding protein YceI
MTAELSTTLETAIPASTTWIIDAAHSEVAFAVKHLMISTVKGRFAKVQGSVRFGETLTAPEVDVLIQVPSIITGDDKRDAHLRSADFFDAETHPTMTFRGRRIEGDPSSRFTLHGDLTIRGTTRPVTLAVTSQGRAADPWGGQRMGFTATTTINRKDFGLTWNVGLEAGGVLVGDDVRITVDTQLVQQ